MIEMKKKTNIRFQLLMAAVMFLVSIFMTVSYYLKISNSEVDKLTTIAFCVWIVSIFAWLIKVIHDTRRLQHITES